MKQPPTLSEFLDNIKSPVFQTELALLTDIAGLLNEFNLKLQIKCESNFELTEAVTGLKKKNVILKNTSSKNDLAHFECCQIILKENSSANFSVFSSEIEK